MKKITRRLSKLELSESVFGQKEARMDVMKNQLKKADIGVIGLAAMGSNLARNLAHHGYYVAVFNRSSWRTEELLKNHGDEGDFIATDSIADLVHI